MSVVRTCIGCRTRAAATDLVRFVLINDSVVVADVDGKLPGRGAHLHPASRCWKLAERRRAFARAFRVKGPVDTSGVERIAADWQNPDHP